MGAHSFCRRWLSLVWDDFRVKNPTMRQRDFGVTEGVARETWVVEGPNHFASTVRACCRYAAKTKAVHEFETRGVTK